MVKTLEEKISKKILINKDYRKNYINSIFENMKTLAIDFEAGHYENESKLKDFLEFSIHEILKDAESIKRYTTEIEILENLL